MTTTDKHAPTGNASTGNASTSADRACGADTTRSVLAAMRDESRPSNVKDALTAELLAAGAPAEQWVRPGSRQDRARRPRARHVLRDTAIEFGVCVRPVLLRRTDTATGETVVVETPCGATRDKVCPPCARQARTLRTQQCREGWHLTEEPDLTPDPGTRTHRDLLTTRADLVAARQAAADDLATTHAHTHDHATPDDATDSVDQDVELVAKTDVLTEIEAAIAELDARIAERGVAGRPEPDPVRRRARSTRRRHDVPDLPRIPSTGATLGRVYDDPKTGRTFRPSMFLTVTLPSYGPVRGDGTPVDPTRYDYPRAARDALHFGKAIDRLVQNLRRVAGYELQYFATVEPQRRLAPHAHFAIRGTLPRAVVKQAVAATYANVWWPNTDRVVYDHTRTPEWDPDLTDPHTGRTTGGYIDPDTRTPLPTWRQALDDLDHTHAEAETTGAPVEPLHCVRFGTQVDVKGVMAGSPEADRLLGYLVKYLVKDLGDDLDTDHTGDHPDPHDPDPHDPDPTGRRLRLAPTPAARAAAARRTDHRARLLQALRHEPCSPRCANWLRYGITPAYPRPGLRPGACKAKAHRPTHLGYGGRRVLTSRKWTGKDLRDHRHDRKAHVLAVLGKTDELAALQHGDPTPGGTHITWELARTTDPDVPPPETRLHLAIAKRVRQQQTYRAARDATDLDSSAPPPAAA